MYENRKNEKRRYLKKKFSQGEEKIIAGRMDFFR
jgi:hypothetical protein